MGEDSGPTEAIDNPAGASTVEARRAALERLRSADRLLAGAGGALRYVIHGPPVDLLIPADHSNKVGGAELEAELVRAHSDTLEARDDLLGAVSLIEVPPGARQALLVRLGVPREVIDGTLHPGASELLRLTGATRAAARGFFDEIRESSEELRSTVPPLAVEDEDAPGELARDAASFVLPGRWAIYVAVVIVALFVAGARCLFESF
jgi:hypothetical protein